MAKPESERPEGCRFWNWPDVRVWIEDNALGMLENPQCKSTIKLTEDAALWWLACRYAEFISDLSFKDTARMILDGMPALTLDDVTEELQLPHKDGDEPTAAIDAAWEKLLRRHFGLDETEEEETDD